MFKYLSMLINVLIKLDFSKERELGKKYKMNHTKGIPFNKKEKEVNLCKREARQIRIRR